MDSYLTNLRQEVQCSLCHNSLVEPKLLQCFHTFCKRCIQRHAEPKEQVHIFKCPPCSSETLLGELCDVEDLQTSPLHTRMLKVLMFSESEKCCSVSATHSPALWQCLDCDRWLCDDCLKYHAIFSSDHRVSSFSDMKKDDLESMVTKRPCKNHSNQSFQFLCKDCDVLICLLCLGNDHKDHKTLTLEEVDALERDFILKKMEDIENLRCNEIEKKQQEKIAVKMKSDGKKAKKKVKKATKKLVKFLLNQEEELLNQIESTVAKAETNLRIIQHIPALKEYMQKMVDNGITSELVNDKNLKINYQTFDERLAGMAFKSNEEWSERVMSGTLGNVRFYMEQTSDSMLSEIQVEQSQFMALKKSKLSVLTKLQNGEINYNNSDVVDIQITPVNDVKVEEETVKTGGKLDIVFTPRVPGTLIAEVKLNGIPVSNSPLVMDVKPQHIEETNVSSTLIKALDTGSGLFTGIAVNKTNSRIAVADSSSLCVRVFTIDGELLLVYDGKTNGQENVLYPNGLAFVSDCNLVIADHGNMTIIIVNTTTGNLVRTVGCLGEHNGEFNIPYGVHVDDDNNIIVSDSGNSRVQVFTKDGDYQYQFTVPNQNNFKPYSTVTHNGLFYVSDWKNAVIHVVQMIDGSPTRVATIGEKGQGVGQLQSSYGLAIDHDHNLLVCDYASERINKFTLDGRYIGSTSKLNNFPLYIAMLNDGRFICRGSHEGILGLFMNSDW